MSLGLSLVAGPTIDDEPISVAVAKSQYLRITHNADDVLIQSLITAARALIEQHTGMAVSPQTWLHTRDRFPLQCEGWQMFIPKPPLRAVRQIQYIDFTTQVLTAVDSAVYWVDANAKPGRVGVNYYKFWPPYTAIQGGAVQILFDCGYASQADIPEPLKTACGLQVQHWYDRPDDRGLAPAVESILGLYFAGSMCGTF